MIVVVGEVLMDLITLSDGEKLSAHIGGGPFNCTLALARLKNDTGFLYPISTDYYGRRIKKFMEQNQIISICPYLSKHSTPLAITHINKNGEADYRFYREKTADRDLKIKKLLAALPKKIELLHTGTLAIANKKDNETVKQILNYAKSMGSLVSIDPNIREKNTQNKSEYRKRVLSIMKMADIIKVSSDDMRFLYPQKSSIEESFKKMCDEFSEVSLKILTQGKNTIIANYQNDWVEYCPEIKSIAGDTIGAGDCFAAGVIHQIKHLGFLSVEKINQMNKTNIKTIMKTASRVAGLNCMKNGCNPPFLDELNKL